MAAQGFPCAASVLRLPGDARSVHSSPDEPPGLCGPCTVAHPSEGCCKRCPTRSACPVSVACPWPHRERDSGEQRLGQVGSGVRVPGELPGPWAAAVVLVPMQGQHLGSARASTPAQEVAVVRHLSPGERLAPGDRGGSPRAQTCCLRAGPLLGRVGTQGMRGQIAPE